MATRRIALVIEYDGTNYCGSQLQKGLPTVQGVIEEAIFKLTGHMTRISMAGRTDAGVHATGQVASFRTAASLPLKAFSGGLNHFLPDDISVTEAYHAEDSLDVRRHAASREYRYSIWNSPAPSPVRRFYTCQVAGRLNTAAMNRACRVISGKHDFASFVSRTDLKGKSTVREVYSAEVKRKGNLVTLVMKASSFLPHQVRNTAGALIRVGLGKMTEGEFAEVFKAAKRGTAGPSAPARGLCLEKVNYPSPLGSKK